MNERIKKLAKQVDSEFNSPYDRHKAIERFAQLIVRECAAIVADAVDQREPASTYVDKIKQHFGVEE